METDKSLSPIKAISYEEYHQIILGLVQQELRNFVTPEMTKGIYEDPMRQDYPARTTVNEIASQATQLRRAATSKELTGWMLPGCDVPRVRGDATNIPGWRPNMVVTQIDEKRLNKPKIIGLTTWGEHVSLWQDRDLARKDQKKVELPLYRPVTIVAGEREFDSQKYRKKFPAWDLLYLKEVHSTAPIEIKSLINLLLTSENVITIPQLSEKVVFTTVVLTGCQWTHSESIDEWGEQPGEFDHVPVKDDQGQQLYAPHPSSGQPVAQYKPIPKRGKIEPGQPFIQDLIGSKPEDQISTATMKVMLGPQDENLKTKQRVRVELQNYRYGRPEMFLFGLKSILLSASQRGNILDSDPTKNPFAVLNDAYRGTKLIVVANVTQVNPSTGADNVERLYCTLVAGLVMYENAHTLDLSDRMIPEFPAGLPPNIIQGTAVETVTPPLDTIVFEGGAKIVGIDPAKGVTSPVVVAPPMRGASPTPVVTEDDSDLTREDELFEMTVPSLKIILRQFRNAGQEVTLRGNKASFVNQILLLEKPGTVPPGEVIEAHKEAVEVAKVEAAEKAESSGEEPKPDLSAAKAALYQKKQAQKDATRELQTTESGPTDVELKRLEEIIVDMIRDVPGEKITWEDLGGDNNDMGIFPTWVTKDHRVMVETMIARIQVELQG